MSDNLALFDPRLYILMRNDLDSLNPGKAVAQGVHAGHQFVFELERDYKDEPDALAMVLYRKWRDSTPHGFGTTISLGVDGRLLAGVVKIAKDAGYPAAVTHDPTYPLVDGKVVHLIPLDTCGYVFGDATMLTPLLRQFNLLP